MQKPKVLVVMPAYNAAATLEKTIADLPFVYVSGIIIVDDASSDGTIARARAIARAHPILALQEEGIAADPTRIPITLISHEKNKGYGGNQKRCYDTALAQEADIVVMVHPDYQYDPKLVKYFVEFIQDKYFDVMLGSRIRTRREALEGGMPTYKYLSNRVLTLLQNMASGNNLGEWHTGMRAYTREVLESIPYDTFSDDFLFDTQMLFAIVERAFRVGDIPVPVRYFEDASSINFSRSLRYGLLTVWETGKFVARTNTLLRYGIAGCLALVSNLGLYWLLLHETDMHYAHAALISFWGGAVISFLLQKFYTFQHHSLNALPRELLIYGVLIGVNSLMNAGLLYLGIHYLAFNAFYANILSNIIVAAWSFFVYARITFVSN